MIHCELMTFEKKIDYRQRRRQGEYTVSSIITDAVI